MAVKTKKTHETREAAATIGTGNPGVAAAAPSMDDVLAAVGVVTAKASPSKKSDLPTLVLDHVVTVVSADGRKTKGNVIDLFVDAVKREITAENDKKLHKATALPFAEELRVQASRKDGKCYQSAHIRGDMSTVTFKTYMYGGVSPSETLSKGQILAAFQSQFGTEWEKYVKVERRLVLSKGLTPKKVMEIIRALAEHGLNFGELVSEEVEYKTTDLLQEHETMDPKFAAKVNRLRDMGVVRPRTMAFQAVLETD
jgi:hypothetical protein